MNEKGENKLFVFGKRDADECREFNETPFVKNSQKYSTLMSFISDSKEYCVGDFFQDSENKIFQIEKLEYDQVDTNKITDINCFPRLVLTCRHFATKDRRNVVRTSQTARMLPGGIRKKVEVYDFESWCIKNIADSYCCQENEDGSPYVPLSISTCLPEITNGKWFKFSPPCFILIFLLTHTNNNFCLGNMER